MDPQDEAQREQGEGATIGGAQLGVMAAAACCMCLFVCFFIVCKQRQPKHPNAHEAFAGNQRNFPWVLSPLAAQNSASGGWPMFAALERLCSSMSRLFFYMTFFIVRREGGEEEREREKRSACS